MIGNTREHGGLFSFEDGLQQEKLSSSTCLESVSISSNHEIMLWHYRLGHPNFQYLKTLVSSIVSERKSTFFSM